MNSNKRENIYNKIARQRRGRRGGWGRGWRAEGEGKVERMTNKGRTELAKLHHILILYLNLLRIWHNIILKEIMGVNSSRNANTQLQIHFNVCKPVEYGKAVYVVGNIQQLGAWDVQASLRLFWSEVRIL